MTNHQLITPDMLTVLPDPVQRYLTYAGVVGTPWIDTVRLQQRGTFRTGEDRPWMPVTAEETYTTNPPSLIWNARFKLFGLPLLLFLYWQYTRAVACCQQMNYFDYPAGSDTQTICSTPTAMPRTVNMLRVARRNRFLNTMMLSSLMTIIQYVSGTGIVAGHANFELLINWVCWRKAPAHP